MGPLPFAQDIRGDTGWREGKGRKESCLSSFSISISRDQTGYLDSEQMVLLSTTQIIGTVTLSVSCIKIGSSRVLFGVLLQYIASSILSSLSPPKSSPLSKYDMI